MHYAAEVNQAALVIRQGGIVAYATEYCFGLGCNPSNRNAVMRLLRFKRRTWHKGLIVIAADSEQLAGLVEEIPTKVLKHWPGPVTYLLAARPAVPRWLRGKHETLAVRVTAHPQAALLCRQAGMAIVSTSANRAGQQPVRDYRSAWRRLREVADFILPGQVGKLSAPTPIIDAASGRQLRG